MSEVRPQSPPNDTRSASSPACDQAVDNSATTGDAQLLAELLGGGVRERDPKAVAPAQERLELRRQRIRRVAHADDRRERPRHRGAHPLEASTEVLDDAEGPQRVVEPAGVEHGLALRGPHRRVVEHGLPVVRACASWSEQACRWASGTAVGDAR